MARRYDADGGPLRGAVICNVNGGADYSPDEIAFMKAVQSYKERARRSFPTWCEVLDIFKSLGYRKTEPEQPLPTGPRRPPE